MGKAKKLRSTSHKKKTSSVTGASLADMEAYAHLPREQAEMFQGLSNDQGSIREATCVALATMFGDLHSDDEERKSREKLTRMVENGLLRKLVPLIADPLKMVRLHALGALRNISVTGGIDTCELMTVDASVVTPLVRLVAETATLERLEKNDLHGVQVLEQAMALLTNLCESSAAAIHELTRGNLLDPIMLIARHGRAHNALHLETLKLLLLITDGNATLSDVFGSNAAYQTVLGELIEADAASVPMLTRLHVVGIAMHIQVIMQNDANVAKLLPIIDAALAYDAVHVVQAAQQAAEGWALAHQTPYDDHDDADPITDEAKAMQTQAQLKVRLWEDNVQTLMLALELVAELAAPTGDDDDADEDEWASDDEEAMEQYAASQMDTAVGSGASASSGMGAALAASQALPLCVTILQGLVSVPSIDNATIAHDFERIRIRVANALTNLVGSLPWELLHNDALPQLFRNFCTLYRNVVTESATKKLDIDVISSTNDVEAATTAAMWAVLRRCSCENQQLPIAGDDATLIMTSALQSKSVATRLNTIGMVGCVGQQTKDAAENAVVGRCLLSSLNDGNLEVVAEALNALFDVYGDEDFDGTFKELGLLPALEAVVPMFKSKLRAEQKALDRDVVAHLKETQLNLMRFIKYKKKHL